MIVGLDVMEKAGRHVPGSSAELQYRADVMRAQDALLAAMPVASGFNAESAKRFEFIPFLALDVDEAGLTYLRTASAVVSIEEDLALPALLAESTPRIHATNAWAAGYTGAGQTVAILDTGVDKTHSFLSGKVVSEACYSTTSATTTSVCPGGVSSSTATGSGVPCNVSGCTHGTHVAGIAAGEGTSFSGVARDANLIAVQVFTRFDTSAGCSPSSAPCIKSYTSDQILGLQRVYALRTSQTIASVNISIGGGKFTSNCDATMASQKAAIDSLRAVGIATVIASGNDYYKDGMSQPACISTAISVGSTIDSGALADSVSSFSNSASFLTLLAPGELINSSIPGGGFDNYQGTSMATPHVAGAIAVLRHKCPSATIDQIVTALTTTGLSVTDTNGISKRRIDVEAALAVLCGGGGPSCGTAGLTAIATGPAPQSAPQQRASIQPPSIRGLPEGGVWQREQREGGETWTYTFEVAETPATDVQPRAEQAGGVVRNAPLDARAQSSVTSSSEAGGSARGSGTDSGLPVAGTIGAREATAAERQRFDFFKDVSSSDPIAGIAAAEGGANARAGSTAFFTRLDNTPIPLIGTSQDRVRLSALDLLADDLAPDQTISSTRLFLKLNHPRRDRVDLWLTTADRQLRLWNGALSSPAAPDTPIVIDRYLPADVLESFSTRPWTLLVSDASETGSGVLDEAWMVTTVAPAIVNGVGDPQATLDVAASRAYLRTAASGGGSEVSTPTVGQAVYLYLDYQVTGSGSSFYLNHRATLDGSVYCSFDAVASPGYVYYAWCGSAWTATSGSHTLRWDLDYYNAVSETNESNNAATKTFTPTGGVDVSATRSYLRTAASGGGSEVTTPTVGQTVYFHVDYQVAGSGSSFNLNHRATLDGSLYCSFDATAIPGDWYYAWCSSGWTATSGSHTIRWDLDYYNTVAESNESNNYASKTFTPSGGVDVSATRSYLRTAASGGGSEVSTPTVGQTVYFHVDYQVTGSGNSFTLNHRATLDSSVYCSFDASATPGYTYTAWCSSGWTATSGSHTLRWDLDYYNTVAESNENNNYATKTFTPSGGIDVAAQRAFMRTASGNGGSEVPLPSVGQGVYFHADYQVTGTGTITLSHRAVLDGGTFCSFDASATAGNGYVAWCNSAWTATAGSHTLRWDLDYNNTVSETNEGNNSASVTFTPSGGGVDLAMQRAFMKTAALNGGSEVAQPTLGQTVYFHGAYQVTGSGSGLTVSQRAVLDGTTFCSCVTAAAAGNSYVASCNQGWTATAGSHTLQWELDYTSSLAETNEGNNSATNSFTTSGAPTVTTNSASAITQTGATLNGTVNPNGSTTSTSFEYGLTAGYGNVVSAQSLSGSSPQSISAPISGLSCGVTYHFRAKATNASGTSYGGDKTVTAGQCPPSAADLYLVTPCRIVDSRNATGPYGGPALAANAVRDIVAVNVCGIPAGTKAVAVNLVAVAPQTTGYLTLFPAGINLPMVSTLNYRLAKTRANSAIVMLSNGGAFSIYNGGPYAIHFIVDVTAYFK